MARSRRHSRCAGDDPGRAQPGRVEHDVKEYADAGHGFINDHEGAGDKMPMVFSVFGKFASGLGYHEASAQDARRRISAFFEAHLKS